MDSITAILDADADGKVLLTLPDELKEAKVLVKATVERVSETSAPRPFGVWGSEGEFWMSPDFDEPLDDFREYME